MNTRRHSLAPYILIVLGILFLLSNFHILPERIWADVWRMWPLILILIGLRMLARRGDGWGTGGGWDSGGSGGGGGGLP